MRTYRLFGLAALLYITITAFAQGTPAQDKTKATEEKWELKDLCSFYLDFDGTVDARFADGTLTPNWVNITVDGKAAAKPDFTDYYIPGIRGKALSTTNGKTTIDVRYDAEKNFNTRQGTLIFWMCYPEVLNSSTGNCVFNNGGYISMGRQVKDGKTTEAAIIYFPTPPDLKGAHNIYMVIDRVPWKAKEWHQVVLAWDLQEARYYEDGKLLSKEAYETGQPQPEKLTQHFAFSLAEWAGTNHDTVAIDEFYLFPMALPDDSIQKEYLRIKNQAEGEKPAAK